MTAVQATVIRCDGNTGRCPELLVSRVRETEAELRRRSMRENGWRYVNQGGRIQDLCRWHA